MTDHTGGTTTTVLATAAVASSLLSACGGGAEDGDNSAGLGRAQAASVSNPGEGEFTRTVWRFLNQATMGPIQGDIDRVIAIGYAAWIDEQVALPRPVEETFDYNYARNSKILLSDNSILGTAYENGVQKFGYMEGRFNFYGVWYDRATSGADQLRQRVAFALSQILVISVDEEKLADRPRAAAAYYDLLMQHAFGSYRDLVEAICKSPAMGHYLTHLGNPKITEGSSRIPDQNFARELIQLFTLGLTELNMDGSPDLDSNGKQKATCGKADVATLSHVFTGWAMTNDLTQRKNYDQYSQNGVILHNDTTGGTIPLVQENVAFGSLPTLTSDWRWTAPMAAVADQHALTNELPVGEKKLFDNLTLGTPQASLTSALTKIFAHKNLAPFVAKQMIQRLVTSNPSPAYVQAVATSFKGAAGTWSILDMVKAILLHPEARDLSQATAPTYGKVREPLLRLTHMLRAHFKPAMPNTTSRYVGPETIDSTATRVTAEAKVSSWALNQAPLSAPSVFNYYSPTFRLPLQAESDSMYSPEMQLVTDSAAAGYINTIYDILYVGFRDFKNRAFITNIDVHVDYVLSHSTSSPTTLGNYLRTRLKAQLLGGGALSTEASAGATKLNNLLLEVCSPVNAQDRVEVTNRIKAAIFMIMCSPEYIVQK